MFVRWSLQQTWWCTRLFGWAVVWLMLSIMGLRAAPALAQTESNYFEATVPVASQSARERSRAASLGLKQVLVRVSGVQDVTQSQAVRSALGRASTYIDQFHYERAPDPQDDKTEQLVMAFAPEVIERLLHEAALPFWPTNRPKVLVWLAQDSAEEGKQLLNDREHPMVEALMAQARERGLPLVLPLLDLEDQLAIEAEDVWELDAETVRQASERYGVDTLLMGRFTKTSRDQWWASWEFSHRGEQQTADLRSEEITEVAAIGVNPLADYLAGLYAVNPNAEAVPQLFVRVEQVEDFQDYRGVLDYLDKLALVNAYELLAIVDNHLLLSLQMGGSVDQLRNALSLDAKMSLKSQESAPQTPWMTRVQGSQEAPLELRWLDGEA